MEDHTVIKDASGFKSRKLVLVIIAKVLVTVGALIAARWPAFSANYDTFIGGIIGLTSLYVIGNVSNTVLSGKVNATVKMAALKQNDSKEEEK